MGPGSEGGRAQAGERGGGLVADGDEVTHVPAYQVTAVDASGAGDAFNGAFAARLVEGAKPVEAAEYAVAAAALTTAGHGAVPSPNTEIQRHLATTHVIRRQRYQRRAAR